MWAVCKSSMHPLIISSALRITVLRKAMHRPNPKIRTKRQKRFFQPEMEENLLQLVCGGDCGVIRDEMASTPISSSFSHLALSATCFLCCWVARECTLNIRGDAHKHVHQWWCRLAVSSGTWICDKMQNFALHWEYLDILQDFEVNFSSPSNVCASLDIISSRGRHEALYGSNYGMICINYDLISVLVSKRKHADLEYEIICRPFRS